MDFTKGFKILFTTILSPKLLEKYRPIPNKSQSLITNLLVNLVQPPYRCIEFY